MKDYVIGVGLKGQNVVLKEFAAIKKAGTKLSKSKITANVTAKVSAAGSGTSKSAGAARTEAKQLAKVQGKAFAEYTQHAQRGAAAGRDVLGSAMTSGVSGVASMLPGIGALFSASQSAVGSAAQEFIAGITASKNIRLVTSNFNRAFGESMNGAFSNSMFASRQNQAVYANLAEQGVKTTTLSDRSNVDTLDKFARAQGVGSLEELFQRMQSGQLKEGAGLGKGEIEFLKSASQMLNSRYSSEIGMQTILRTLKGRGAEIGAVAGTSNMQGLAQSVRGEGNIQQAEQNYQALAGATIGDTGYSAMTASRLADLRLRARTVGMAATVNRFQTEVGNQVADIVDDVRNGDWRALGARAAPGYIDPRAAQRQGVRLPGAPAPAPAAQPEVTQGGGEEMGGSASGGAAPLSQSNSDLTRAGASLAATLSAINNQLMAIQYQMRTRGG